MAAAKSANGLKALQDRVAELESQLRELKAQLATQPAPRQYWPDRPHTEEEAEAFHQASQWVNEYIQKEREKDRRRVNAAIDRQEARERKAAAAQAKKTSRAKAKARKAG